MSSIPVMPNPSTGLHSVSSISLSGQSPPLGPPLSVLHPSLPKSPPLSSDSSVSSIPSCQSLLGFHSVSLPSLSANPSSGFHSVSSIPLCQSLHWPPFSVSSIPLLHNPPLASIQCVLHPSLGNPSTGLHPSLHQSLHWLPLSVLQL
ncbi:unnamed protein product, partial [Staurois parvus]